MDDHGHGTHCAAIAAGNGFLKGVAPDATLYGIKVLNRFGSGTQWSVIKGIEWSLDPNGDGNYNDKLDIISLSLGGRSGHPDDPVSLAIDSAVNHGVVAVVAAGNRWGLRTITTPGTARNAITVGASDKNLNPAFFSSKGPVSWYNPHLQKEDLLLKPDVSAPGVDICAAQWEN